MNSSNNHKLKDMTFTALMTALLCVLGPLSVPIGPIPISLQSLVVYIIIYVIGMKRGTLAVLLYLLIGLIGLPVFSGFSGGPQKLFGPTGGYLIGFIFVALIAGAIVDRHSENRIFCFLGLVLSTAFLYALGTAWLAYSAGMTFQAALAAGVLPFIGIDIGKMIVTVLIGPILRNRLSRAGLIEYPA